MLHRPVRIVHCDDSQSFLLLTRDWLEDHRDLEIVHSALGADEALSAVRALHPDVVVTDTFGSPSDPATSPSSFALRYPAAEPAALGYRAAVAP